MRDLHSAVVKVVLGDETGFFLCMCVIQQRSSFRLFLGENTYKSLPESVASTGAWLLRGQKIFVGSPAFSPPSNDLLQRGECLLGEAGSQDTQLQHIFLLPRLSPLCFFFFFFSMQLEQTGAQVIL